MRRHIAALKPASRPVLATMGLAALVLSACAADSPGDDDAGAPVVLAAASAEPALEQLARAPEVGDAVSGMAPEYAGTSTLVSQIESGRSFDVVLSASRRHMSELQQGEHIAGDPIPVATNRLVLAVPAANPGGVESFEDFAARAEELTTAICAPQVPCGMLAETLSEELDLDLHAATEETSVAAVLSKISLGEVDAGLVYRTDAEAAGEDVQAFQVPEVHGGTNQMWAGLSTDPPHPQAAEQLMGALASESGRAAFEQAGFLPPPAAEAGSGTVSGTGADTGPGDAGGTGT